MKEIIATTRTSQSNKFAHIFGRYQDRTGIVDNMLAASFAVRQSKAIPARHWRLNSFP
jgi:hypothetical protein